MRPTVSAWEALGTNRKHPVGSMLNAPGRSAAWASVWSRPRSDGSSGVFTCVKGCPVTRWVRALISSDKADLFPGNVIRWILEEWASGGVVPGGPPIKTSVDVAAEFEELGYTALWSSGGFQTGLSRHFERLLAATSRLMVISGIVSIWATTPDEIALAVAELDLRHPGRFVLGLGASHAAIVPNSPAIPPHGRVPRCPRRNRTLGGERPAECSPPSGLGCSGSPPSERPVPTPTSCPSNTRVEPGRRSGPERCWPPRSR